MFGFGVWVFLSASECQIEALDNLSCRKEIFLESEELGKLDTSIVGKLFSKFEGFFCVYEEQLGKHEL